MDSGQPTRPESNRRGLGLTGLGNYPRDAVLPSLMVLPLFANPDMSMQLPLLAGPSGAQAYTDAALAALGTTSGAVTGIALGTTTGPDVMMIATVIVGVIALAAVAKVVKARRATRSMGRIARNRAQAMTELLRTVRMAETIAGIGVWQYDPAAGTQQWSNGLKRLFGLEFDDAFVEGDAETLLFAHDIDLVGKVNENRGEAQPYSFGFDICEFDGNRRSISVQACNLMNAAGSVHRVVAVVRDNTEQVNRERELESSCAKAIDEARHARELAETDALTGLANRRRVMRELDRIVLHARVTQMPMVLIMFDIDHFKQVNDTYGHPYGDKVLQRVARLANGQARSGDIVGRVGGEEFVWIIPSTSDGMARIMAERLRQVIAEDLAPGQLASVTISIGYTCINAADTALSLFARADGALYEAKNLGRNRVRMAA